MYHIVAFQIERFKSVCIIHSLLQLSYGAYNIVRIKSSLHFYKRTVSYTQTNDKSIINLTCHITVRFSRYMWLAPVTKKCLAIVRIKLVEA